MNDQLKKIISDVLQVDIESDDSSSTDLTTAELDSIKLLMIISELESQFQIEFEPEEIGKMKSLLDIFRILNTKGIS